MNQSGHQSPKSIDDLGGYVILKDKSIVRLSVMVVTERTEENDDPAADTMLDEVFEDKNVTCYWSKGEFISSVDSVVHDERFSIQIIKILKWELPKFDERMKSYWRRMEWKYPGYQDYCKKLWSLFAGVMIQMQS